jgi:ATP-dependent Clp protease ATP-binding subunit ClpC
MSLTDEDLIKIMHLLVEQINKNLETKQIKIRLNDDAAKYILEKTCGDRSYGARPLRRALQKYIEDPLSEALIQGLLPKPAELDIYLGDMGIYYRLAGSSPLPVAVAAGEPETEAEPVLTPGIALYTF